MATVNVTWFVVCLKFCLDILVVSATKFQMAVKKKLKENGNNTAEKWENLCSNEIISITQSDINKMVKKCTRYCYSHKHYCFRKQRERCSHYKTTKWERLLQHPVLYLLKLNFAEAKKNIDVGKWQNNKMYPIEFIFQEGFPDKYKT